MEVCSTSGSGGDSQANDLQRKSPTEFMSGVIAGFRERLSRILQGWWTDAYGIRITVEFKTSSGNWILAWSIMGRGPI